MTKECFAAFESFVEYSQQIEKLLTLSIHAISGLEGSGKLVDVLNEGVLDGERPKYSPEHVAHIHAMEELAASQTALGHPMLIAHSVVALWSALEASIPAFCSDWIVANPSCLSSDGMARIKISAIFLAGTDRRSAAEAIVEEISRQLDASLRPGIGRFQGVLEKIGISFPIEDDVRRTLFELSKVRNLIVHRFGRADRKFVEECSGFALNVGDELRLTLDHYAQYRRAAGEYAAQIVLCARRTSY